MAQHIMAALADEDHIKMLEVLHSIPEKAIPVSRRKYVTGRSAFYGMTRNGLTVASRTDVGKLLCKAANEMLAKYIPTHFPDFTWCSLCVNVRTDSQPHKDVLNRGLSIIGAFGEFEGGRLLLHDDIVGEVLREYDIKNSLMLFNGREEAHSTSPWVGKGRYSIVFYEHRGWVPRQAGLLEDLRSLGFQPRTFPDPVAAIGDGEPHTDDEKDTSFFTSAVIGGLIAIAAGAVAVVAHDPSDITLIAFVVVGCLIAVAAVVIARTQDTALAAVAGDDNDGDDPSDKDPGDDEGNDDEDPSDDNAGDDGKHEKDPSDDDGGGDDDDGGNDDDDDRDSFWTYKIARSQFPNVSDSNWEAILSYMDAATIGSYKRAYDATNAMASASTAASAASPLQDFRVALGAAIKADGTGEAADAMFSQLMASEL